MTRRAKIVALAALVAYPIVGAAACTPPKGHFIVERAGIGVHSPQHKSVAGGGRNRPDHMAGAYRGGASNEQLNQRDAHRVR
jgi:hypothetical protein